MTQDKSLVLYAAAYGDVQDALRVLGGIERLRKNDVIGNYDAAVIDKKDGKPHIAKRVDHPGIRVIPEWFGGGTLPHKDLAEAAKELTGDEAGLIVIGEPTIEKALDEALTGASKIVKHELEATIDEITSELQEALKSLGR